MSTPSPLFIVPLLAVLLALSACRPSGDAPESPAGAADRDDEDDDHDHDQDDDDRDGPRTDRGDPVAALGTIRVVAPEAGDPFAPVPPDTLDSVEPDTTAGDEEAGSDARLLAWGLTPEDLTRVRGDADDADKERARLENKAGLKRHRKLDLKAAVERYRAALAAWPGHPFANYNLACAHALLGQRPLAIKHLAVLVALNDETSKARLRSARTDADFDSLRTDVDYQRITHYLPAHVAWSPGAADDRDAADAIRELREHKIPAVDAGSWHQDLAATTLFTAKGDEGAALLADEIEAAATFELKRVESTFLDMARPLVLVIGSSGTTSNGDAETPRRPADFVGKTLSARTDDAGEHLTLKRTGFFSWERIEDDGTRVTRSGRYLIDKGKLSLDFRQVTERPVAGGGQPEVTVEQGRRTNHTLAVDKRALVVDGLLFEEGR